MARRICAVCVCTAVFFSCVGSRLLFLHTELVLRIFIWKYFAEYIVFNQSLIRIVCRLLKGKMPNNRATESQPSGTTPSNPAAPSSSTTTSSRPSSAGSGGRRGGPSQERGKPNHSMGKPGSKAPLSSSAKRIQKELAEITLDPPPNCR
nr:uncharacterized protein LOC129259131 [Lytechinus pictus]